MSLAQCQAQALWQGGSGTEERQAVRAAIEQLTRWHDATPDDKPVLPRLRMECFRVGDAVRLYLGDTPGALQTWACATISEKTKSHRTDWKNAPSRGYYWRHLAQGKQPLFTDSNTVAFATSEPRVIRETDWHWFQRALSDNDPYVDTFTANAHSDWQPLWCLERNQQARGESGDFRHWLLGYASIFPDA